MNTHFSMLLKLKLFGPNLLDFHMIIMSLNRLKKQKNGYWKNKTGMYRNRVKNDKKFLFFCLVKEEIQSGKIQNDIGIYFEFILNFFFLNIKERELQKIFCHSASLGKSCYQNIYLKLAGTNIFIENHKNHCGGYGKFIG